MLHKFGHYLNKKSNKLTIHGEICGLQTIYEIDEVRDVFLSSDVGANNSLCGIYSLNENELRELREDKQSCDKFLAELEFPFESNFETLLAIRLKIVENKVAAQTYYLKIIGDMKIEMQKVAERASRKKSELSDHIERLLGSIQLLNLPEKDALKAAEIQRRQHIESEQKEALAEKLRLLLNNISVGECVPKKNLPAKRKKTDRSTAEIARSRPNSRSAAAHKVREVAKRIERGSATPEVTIIIDDEVFHISDSKNIAKIRAERIIQLEIALRRFKLGT